MRVERGCVVSETSPLRAQLERLKFGLKGRRMALWDWNMQSGVTVFDDTWAEMLGYELAELGETTVDTWAGLTHPDDLPNAMRAIDAHVTGRVPYYDITFRMHHRQGHWIWVHDRGILVERSPDGAGLRMIGTHEDVTERTLAEQALAQSERRFASMFDDHDAVMLLIDPASGDIVNANKAAAHFYGYSIDVLCTMSIDQINTLLSEDIRHRRDEASARDRASFVFPHRLASGEVRMVEVHSSPIDDHGRPLLFSIIRDVTEREVYEARLREDSAILRSITEAFVIVDGEGIIRRTNPAFTTVTGWKSEALVGHHISRISGSPDPEAEAQEIRNRHSSGQGGRREMVIRHADGRELASSVSINPILGPMGELTGYAILITDLTERTRAERAERDHLRNYDMLTGLPNRNMLDEMLSAFDERLRATGTSGALLLLDLDRFKSVNDSFGHAAGDLLLAAISSRLVAALRSSDVMAHLAGDEFAILINGVEGDAAAIRAGERLLRSLTEPFVLSDDIEVFVTACMGAVSLPGTVASTGELLQLADLALREAKVAGPGSIRSQQQPQLLESRLRKTRETSVHHAWNDREFQLWLQPQVDVATGDIVAAEALMRWIRHDGRSTPPGDFIPVLEETGLIVDVGLWVVDEACRLMADWDQHGLGGLRMAINVSSLQLDDERLAKRIEESLAVNGINGRRLTVEVTESALLNSGRLAQATFADLRALGIRLAIDDFGTGYSSFSALKQLPLEKLKIDRSFVNELATSSGDRAITEAIISMGHALDLRVLAEGVETGEQLSILRKQGCDLYQGFYLSPAVAPDDFIALVRGHAASAAPHSLA